jgi:hypothetical protein
MSIARTRKTCSPTIRSAYSIGDEHSLTGSASSWHSNVDIGSLETKLKLASISTVEGSGPDRIVVVGGVVSRTTVQRQVAGVAS